MYFIINTETKQINNLILIRVLVKNYTIYKPGE